MNVLEVLTARGGAETPKMATSSQEDANAGEFLLTFEEELGHLCTFVAHNPEAAPTSGPGLSTDLKLGVPGALDPSGSAMDLTIARGEAADLAIEANAGKLALDRDVAPKATTGLKSEIVETGIVQTGATPAQINQPELGAVQSANQTIAREQKAVADHSASTAESSETKINQRDVSQPQTAASSAMPLGLAVGDAAAAPRAASQHQATSNETGAGTQRSPILNLSQRLAAQAPVPHPSGQAGAQLIDGLPSDGREWDRSLSKASQINAQDIESATDRITRNHVTTSGSFAAYERVAMPQVATAAHAEPTSTVLQANDPLEIVPMREAAMTGAAASSAPASTLPTGLSAPAPAPVHQILNQISVIEDKASAGVLEVRLDPEDLGKVRLSFVTRDTGLVVSVFAERPETLELLRRNSDELQLGLSDMNFEGADLEFSAKQGESDADREDELEAGTETRLSEAVVSKHVIAAVADDRLDIRL